MPDLSFSVDSGERQACSDRDEFDVVSPPLPTTSVRRIKENIFMKIRKIGRYFIVGLPNKFSSPSPTPDAVKYRISGPVYGLIRLCQRQLVNKAFQFVGCWSLELRHSVTYLFLPTVSYCFKRNFLLIMPLSVSGVSCSNKTN